MIRQKSHSGADALINDEWTRAVVGAPFGYACYELAPHSETQGDYVAKHVGLVGDEADAKAFLAGAKAKRLIRVYADDGRVAL